MCGREVTQQTQRNPQVKGVEDELETGVQHRWTQGGGRTHQAEGAPEDRKGGRNGGHRLQSGTGEAHESKEDDEEDGEKPEGVLQGLAQCVLRPSTLP